ncbi:MAG: MCP four helix bundle domain-containing protein, partial [Sulfuritalea sp.]|nr:MCP four helix bundle domain-containing protein [Sulfuritalea sp.]
MNWLLNVSTRAKLFLGFGLMLTFLGIVATSAYWGITSIQAAQKTLYEEDFADVSDIQDVLASLDENRAGLLSMLLLTQRSEQEAVHRTIREQSQANEAKLRQVKERSRDDAQVRALLDELEQLRREYREIREQQTVPLIYQGKTDQAVRLVIGIQAERFARIQAVTERLIELTKSKAGAGVARAEHEALLALRQFVAVGTVALAVGLFMALLLNRMIAVPLREIAGRAGRIADGEIALRPAGVGYRRDEIGFLEEQFDRMAGSLQAKVDTAQQIATGDLRVEVKLQSENDALGIALATMVKNLREMNREIG